jgi:hypothetical protein
MPTRATTQDSSGVFGRFQDIEVTGQVIGPQFSRIFSAIDALVAHNEIVTLGNSVLRGLDPIPAASELFDLSQPDCVSSLGRRPSTKEITYEPGHLYDEVGTEYNNALAKFPGRGTIGCFGATTNLVQSPEDLTDATYWTPTSATAAASAYSWRGRPFTLVTASASTAGNVTQILAATSGQIHCFSVTVRKGSGATSQLLIRDSYAGTVRANVTITWATASAAAATGTLFRADFYASDTICEVVVIGTAVGSATPVVTLRPDTTAGTGTAYFTAVQVEDKDFATPYIPTSRSDHSRIVYSIDPAGTGTIELRLRPWHTYDIADRDKYVFVLGGTGASIANTVSLRYDIATDKYIALIYQDASNYRSVASDSAFATNASLWAWRHLKVVWDIPNQTIQLFVDGAEQTTAASAGTVSGMTYNANALIVGGLGNSVAVSLNDYVANALITDFLYQPSTEDTSTTHYTGGVPWYDTSEVTNKYQSVRINRYGIRLHNANIGITDDLGRYIGISPAEGLLARDAAGTTIHDIPTAPILSDMKYGGHILWRDCGTYFSNLALSYTDTQTSRVASSAVTNVSLASVLPPGLSNAKGLLVSCEIYLSAAAAKVAAGSWFDAYPSYATSYGASPAVGNFLGYRRYAAPVATVAVYDIYQFHALVPVVWSGGVPYVTWYFTMNFGAAGAHPMAAGNANYRADAALYALGLLV